MEKFQRDRFLIDDMLDGYVAFVVERYKFHSSLVEQKLQFLPKKIRLNRMLR